MTNAWLIRSQTIITREKTYNFATWERQCSIVDWDCSKIQTLLEILKILNLPRGEFCVSSEVEHSFLEVGCARNRLQNLKFFHWMLAFAWMEYPRFTFGTWLYILLITFQHEGTRCETNSTTNTPTPTPKRRNTVAEIVFNFQCGSRYHKPKTFSLRSHALHF